MAGLLARDTVTFRLLVLFLSVVVLSVLTLPLMFFLCIFVIFYSYCSHVQVFGKTLWQWVPHFNSNTERYLLFFMIRDDPSFFRRFASQNLTIIIKVIIIINSIFLDWARIVDYIIYMSEGAKFNSVSELRSVVHRAQFMVKKSCSSVYQKKVL